MDASVLLELNARFDGAPVAVRTGEDVVVRCTGRGVWRIEEGDKDGQGNK